MLVKQNPKPTKPDETPPCLIKLTGGLFALVDADDLIELNKFYWIAARSRKKYYAARRVIIQGFAHYIFMHREIMKTPDGQIVHHENGHTYDNRKKNLTNMPVDQHKYIHGFR